MSQHDELKRAAEAVMAMNYPWEHTVRDGRLGKTCTEYARLAHPSNVRALIAENQQLTNNRDMWRGQCDRQSEMLRLAHDMETQLRAEVAGLRTGYQAYEQVNAELKAENEALRKRIEDLSSLKDEPLSWRYAKCLACGGYHHRQSGLPCPKMNAVAQSLSMENQRITPVEPPLATHPLDAATGKGEQ